MTDRLIYFIRPIGQRGPVKIGCSCWPEIRLKALLAWSPVPLEVAASTAGDFKIEARLHSIFRGSHMHSEWFAVSDKLDDVIDAVKAGAAIETLIDMNARVVRPNYKNNWTPERRRRASYAQRLRYAFDRIPFSQPDDVSRIMDRWAGYASRPSIQPTDAEIARLDEVLANPMKHGRKIPGWRRRAA